MSDNTETATPEIIGDGLMTTAEKAKQLGVSASFLHKDRLKPQPLVPFIKYGRIVRYFADNQVRGANTPSAA
ncbi:hypothetical protein [Ruegeria sp. HKCCA5426]|uniref:hypothetical protein n=1 Tax=Ruegeria sp. HKCCA5426 TaxID=2682985 RepID=UPI0014885102|nr:hypothetical protein [Ruegeria sp. HKCCA5426]